MKPFRNTLTVMCVVAACVAGCGGGGEDDGAVGAAESAVSPATEQPAPATEQPAPATEQPASATDPIPTETTPSSTDPIPTTTTPPAPTTRPVPAPTSSIAPSPDELLAALSLPDEFGAGFVRRDAQGAPPPLNAWGSISDDPACAVHEPLWNVEATDKLAVSNNEYVGSNPAPRRVVVFVLADDAAANVEAALSTDPVAFASCWQRAIGAMAAIDDFVITDLEGASRRSGAVSIVWRRQMWSSENFGFAAKVVSAVLRDGPLVASVTLTADPTDADVTALLDDLAVRMASASAVG